jgi:cell division protein FtsW
VLTESPQRKASVAEPVVGADEPAIAQGRTAPRRRSAYTALIGLTATLCFVGLVMVLSASSVVSIRQYGSPWHYFERQALWLVIGAVAFAVARAVPTARWRRLARPAMVVTILLLMAVLVAGRSAGGASRWLGTSTVQIQPSELAKLALVLFAADVLDRRRDKRDWLYRLGPVVVAMGLLVLLILKQPDMGTAVVVFCIGMAVLFSAAAPVRALSALLATGVVGGLGLAVASPYRMQRLLSFRHPFADAGGSGYQSAQALVAMGSGGWLGLGIGHSLASWGYLPNQYTDFIFAIVGEETGLVGSLVVVGLFAALAAVGVRIASQAASDFDALLAAGVTAWLVSQAVINIGAVVGLLPVTGVPLPFVSYGGTSLVIMLFATGLLARVARQR